MIKIAFATFPNGKEVMVIMGQMHLGIRAVKAYQRWPDAHWEPIDPMILQMLNPTMIGKVF